MYGPPLPRSSQVGNYYSHSPKGKCMKDLLLTGVSQSSDFRSGVYEHYILFNGGELAVPVSEESLQVVLEYLQSEEPGEEQGMEEPSSEWEPRSEEPVRTTPMVSLERSEPPPEEETLPLSAYPDSTFDPDYADDDEEDGVGQI